MNEWKKAPKVHGQLIDAGITATSISQLQTERRLRMVNGSGFDELDAVEESLECVDALWEQDADEFGDPLALAIREEEDDE